MATSTNNLMGPPLVISGNITFDSVEWDDTYPFSAPSTIGSLSQTSSLYDGVACSRQRTPLYRSLSSNSSLQSPLSLSQNLTASTVELWFKLPSSFQASSSNQSATPFYLFSLYYPSIQRDPWQLYFNGTPYTDSD
jgi:hypothetical protein